MLAAALIAARFVHFAAALSLFGALAFALYAGEELGGQPLAGWTRRTGLWLALAALLSGLAWFAVTGASMAGSLTAAADPGVLATVLGSTSFGPLWAFRLCLLAMTLVVSLASRGGRWARWASAIMAGLSLACLAGTGHGLAPGGLAGYAHAAADGAHLIAAGLWIGGLWPLGVLLARAARTPTLEDEASVGRLLTRFSSAGIAAVAILVASGLVNSWFLVGSLDRLFGTDYGRLLLAKIVLFLSMAGLAAANRYWITPALTDARAADPRWLARIRRHVALEQALGVAVIAVVSALGTLPTALES